MRGSTRTQGLAAGATVLALAVVAGVLLTQGEDPAGTVVAQPLPVPTAPASPEPTCSTAQRRILPTSVNIPGVDRAISVLPLARDSYDVPGTPPLTLLGKSSMAFDLGSGIRPGDKRGNALLNAHTYPDGSALGNKLLDGLRKGDRIVVSGLGGKICYRVNDRVEVGAYSKGKRYFAEKGKPQIAIIVCSGQRLGPGNWTKRTIWYASPLA